MWCRSGTQVVLRHIVSVPCDTRPPWSGRSPSTPSRGSFLSRWWFPVHGVQTVFVPLGPHLRLTHFSVVE